MSAPSVSPAVLYRRSLESRPAVNLGGIAGHPGHELETQWWFKPGTGGRRRYWSVSCRCGWRNRNRMNTEAKALAVGAKDHMANLRLEVPRVVVSRREVVCPTPSKKRFKSQWSATAELRRAWRTGRGKKLPGRAYKCRCGSWHMTSKPAR